MIIQIATSVFSISVSNLYLHSIEVITAITIISAQLMVVIRHFRAGFMLSETCCKDVSNRLDNCLLAC